MAQHRRRIHQCHRQLAPDLPGLYDSAVAWGDFDNDQRLDLLITGLTNLSGRAEVSQLWRNTVQSPPTNMVFIPPNTFMMGSPASEPHRQTNEGPQTTVTLTRGFWIGKYEVTQGEYLSLMSTNPSQFPGDLSRPVFGVSWPDATNYCWKLTQRELPAGRISPGTQYRLPTEAEWECAARAGTLVVGSGT